MKYFFMNIKIEGKDFNVKIFIFNLYITNIVEKIESSGYKAKFIKRFFEKEIDPTIELSKFNSWDNLMNTE